MSQTVLTSGSDVAAGDSGGVVAACLGHSTVHILDVMRKQQKNDKVRVLSSYSLTRYSLVGSCWDRSFHY